MVVDRDGHYAVVVKDDDGIVWLYDVTRLPKHRDKDVVLLLVYMLIIVLFNNKKC